MEDHYSPIWHSQCTWKYQCLGTLDAGLHVCRTNARLPVAYSSDANSDLWRATSGVLLGIHLCAQLEYSFYQNHPKNSGWPGHACQPSTTDSTSNRDFGGACQQPPPRMDLGGPGPEPVQEQAMELLLKWEHLFASSDLDLG